jgi:3-deoxy-D-manno-octulosonic acid (KDO) 8-phosphate synthase
MTKIVQVGNIACGSDQLFLISGPCVIETEDVMLRTAEKLKEVSERMKVPVIYKSSFTKDNRSSVDFYQGPGSGRRPEGPRPHQEGLRLPHPHRHPLPQPGQARR